MDGFARYCDVLNQVQQFQDYVREWSDFSFLVSCLEFRIGSQPGNQLSFVERKKKMGKDRPTSLVLRRQVALTDAASSV